MIFRTPHPYSSFTLKAQDDESNVVFEPNPWQTHDSEFELDLDADFGGKEARAVLERSLLRKLDRRMSILILIYILNCKPSKLRGGS